jgi:hypothetical protein
MPDLGSTNIDNLPTIQEETINNENKIISNPVQKKNEERNEFLNSNNNSENNAMVNTVDNINLQKNINSQIKQAGLVGATTLSSRDIPMNTTSITNDEQIKNHFIPSENDKNDYITEHLSTEDIIKKNNEKNDNDLLLDNLYSEISIPLLISILYFIFKLPFVDSIYNKFFPFCFSKTGNMKISGYLLSSVIFSLVFYLLNKIIKNLNI